MWCVAIPGGFIAVDILGLPIVAVFFIIRCDEIIKSLVSIVRVSSGKWVRDVTRDFAIEEEEELIPYNIMKIGGYEIYVQRFKRRCTK